MEVQYHLAEGVVRHTSTLLTDEYNTVLKCGPA
jgi:hypothetical protein